MTFFALQRDFFYICPPLSFKEKKTGMGVKSGVGNLKEMEFLNLGRMELCDPWQPRGGQERLCWVLELQPCC